MSHRNPSYRFHKARQCAVVTLAGRNHYLGEYDSPESWEKYHRLVAEHLASGKHAPPANIAADAPLTITEVAARFWAYAKTHYVKYGQPTSEVAAIRHALRFLRRLYGSTPAGEFSPKKLKAVREAMIAHKVVRRYKVVDPQTGAVTWAEKVLHQSLARRTINKQVGRLKRIFAWAVEEELVDVSVHAALLRVRGLRRNETSAREKPRVRPVAEADVNVVLPLVPATIRAMILIQQLCGGRPQDVVYMRGEDIDRSRAIWEYRPRRYKTEHCNPDADPDRDRIVFLGPRAQEILQPFLDAQPEGFLFSPRVAEAERNARKKQNRKSPMTPSQAARNPRGRTRAPLRDHYDVASYRRAIRRACEKADIPIWCPNRLRHSRLTEIRKHFGLEASRVCGGHREVGVTQHYAEQDHQLAREVMAKMG